MVWVAIYVGIGLLGAAVLGAVAFRLYRQVRALMRDVKAASERLATASDRLSQEPGTRSRRA